MFSLSSADDSVPRDTDYLVTQINIFLLPQHEADRGDVKTAPSDEGSISISGLVLNQGSKIT